MASPVIDSVSPAGPISAVTGTKVSITVSAHDPDAKTTTLTGTVTDPEGNVSDQFTVKINFSDGPLTLQAKTDDGTPVTTSGLTAIVG